MVDVDALIAEGSREAERVEVHEHPNVRVLTPVLLFRRVLSPEELQALRRRFAEQIPGLLV